MKVIILAGGFGTRLGEYTDLVPKPMVAAIGCPESICAPSSSPVMTLSRSCFQLGWAITSTERPSASKKPVSLAITMGAQSVSLMKPNFNESFSRSNSPPVSGATGSESVATRAVEEVSVVGLLLGGMEPSADFSSAVSLQEHTRSAARERANVGIIFV